MKENLKLGFGLMRLPMLGEEVDIEQTKTMVDMFLKAGFRYFDTAYGYLGGPVRRHRPCDGQERPQRTCECDGGLRGRRGGRRARYGGVRDGRRRSTRVL